MEVSESILGGVESAESIVGGVESVELLYDGVDLVVAAPFKSLVHGLLLSTELLDLVLFSFRLFIYFPGLKNPMFLYIV